MIAADCPSTGRHGTGYAHRRYGCRCPEAVAARRRTRAALNRRNARLRAARAYIDETAVARACAGQSVRLTRTERRVAIARLDVDGATCASVAATLGLTVRTVQRHRTRRRGESSNAVH